MFKSLIRINSLNTLEKKAFSLSPILLDFDIHAEKTLKITIVFSYIPTADS